MEEDIRNKYRILVVEDDPVSRKMLVTALGKAGYDVDEATDGREAWERFEGQVEVLSAVITDVEMPRMDGLELSRRLRESSPDLPIALLTCRDDKETIKAALRCGVSEFMEKPASISEVTRCAAELVESRPLPTEQVRQREAAEAVRWAQSQMGGEAGEEAQSSPILFHNEPYRDAGGDVFRCVHQEDGSLLFIAADVAGHSVESSYAVASFLGSFAAHSRKQGSITDMLRHLNTEIQHGPFPDIPVCALLGQWFPQTGWLYLANAGFPHPCIYEPRRSAARQITLDGTPLGLFPDPLLEYRVFTLSEGDRLLMGSDGLFDLLNQESLVFEDRLCAIWQECSSLPLRDALARVRQRAHDWVGGELKDDLLVIGFSQAAKEPRHNELSLELVADLGESDRACAELGKFLEASSTGPDLGEKGVFDLMLAAREAVANAVLHGSAGIGEARIGFRCWTKGLSLFVSVTDEGPGVDIDAVTPPSDDLREGGRGVPLMRNLAAAISSVPGEVRLRFDLLGGNTGHGGND